MILQNLLVKNIFKTLCLISFISISNVWGASGDLDTGFNTSAYRQPSGLIYALARQTDGKLLIGGQNFEIVNGRIRRSLARMNADDTLDTTFNASRVSGEIYAMGLQSDGKIIISGAIDIDGVRSPIPIIRLNPDGSIDNTFTVPIMTGTTFFTHVQSILVLPNDKLLIGGTFSYFPASGSSQRSSIARLNSNGVTDETFNAGQGNIVLDIEVQPDGKILGASFVSGPNRFLRRLNPDGTVDDTFNTIVSTSPTEFKIQPDGKILIGGNFQNVNNFPRNNLARLNTDGSLDETFTANNFNSINDIELDINSKILVNGTFTSPGGNRFNMARLNTDGSLDLSFNFVPTTTNSVFTVRDILPLTDGNILIGGDGFRQNNLGGMVFRLNSDGLIDNSLNVLTGSRGTVWEIVTQADGKILLGGLFGIVNSILKPNIVRLNRDGTIDNTFNPVILGVGVDPTIRAIVVQPDGKIIVGGQFIGMIIRLNPDGSRDNSFTTNLETSGPVYDIQILPDGKILAVGEIKINGDSNNRYIARFNANGSLDTTFVQAFPSGTVFKVITQPDGKIIICGNFTSVGGFLRGRVARLNSDGSVDTSFNPLGGANSTVYEVGLQSDGRLIIAGLFTNVNGTGKNYLARLNSNGTLDTGFGANFDASLSTVRIQPDDRILIGGSFFNVNGNQSRGMTRLKADGTFDATFNAGAGVDGAVLVFERQANNKLLIGGNFAYYKNIEKLSIARLLDDSPTIRRTPFDFDGDGRSDVSVFRTSTNRWYEFLSSNSSVFETTFGVSNDIVAPSDFDGDGKTDIGIFRPSTGDWWYLSSINNAQVNVHFGASGDIPRPSDFDGDGKADFIVFRPSNSVWYRLTSTGVVSVAAFGTSGDKPLVGDFDGDGKSDLGIYRPSTGTWWYQSSLNNSQIAIAFGISTDIPVPADYDGDCKTDLAVYRPSTGVWYILNSSSGQATIIPFGLSEDKPVAADYDGDGKADIAVYRPSSGVWYLLRSTAGFSALQFGISTDIPLANSFVP